MFDPKEEVPSLELCRKLKKLGYLQDGGWYWIKENSEYNVIYVDSLQCNLDSFLENLIKAPTVRELGEWLPYKIKFRKKATWGYLRIEKDNTINDWNVGYTDEDENYIIFFGDDTEAEARAKMLIWLVENEYVSFNKKD